MGALKPGRSVALRWRSRLLTLGVGASAYAALGVGLFCLVNHLALFAARADFPLDLEWMEGGMLLHATRLAAGQTIYAAPSLDFIPYLYTPLYPALLAGLGKVLPFGYLLGRAVSIGAFAGALGLLVLAAVRQAPRGDVRVATAAWAVGLGTAGAVAGGFAFTGSFYDLVRADSLLLLLEAGALALALWGPGRRTAAAAGVVIALGFFTKQTAALIGVAIGLGLLASQWRRGLVYGLAAALTLAAGLLLLEGTSGGWFWRYVFELHQSHGFNARLAYVETPLRLARQHGPAYAALAVCLLALALAGRLERRDLIHLLAALAGFAAACVGFGTQWAFDNAFIPAVFFPLFSLAVLGGRLVARALEDPRPGLALPALLVGAALVRQILPGAVPDRTRFVPSARDRTAAARFLERVRGLEGPLFIPFHPYYAVLAGSPPHAHRMGVLDVAARYGRPAGLDQALAEGRFGHVILDWKSQPWEWPTLDARYHEVGLFNEGVDAVRAFSGAETSPRRLLARTVLPPALPAGARRLFDFETGWQGWASGEGEAFGPRPAVARAGLFGRAAADSSPAGPAAQGALRSPPFTLAGDRLRFRLAGPTDPGLRVLLLDGPEAVRSATPSGRPTDVEWEVADLRGRPLTLVIEDRSAGGALAVDEIVELPVPGSGGP